MIEEVPVAGDEDAARLGEREPDEVRITRILETLEALVRWRIVDDNRDTAQHLEKVVAQRRRNMIEPPSSKDAFDFCE